MNAPKIFNGWTLDRVNDHSFNLIRQTDHAQLGLIRRLPGDYGDGRAMWSLTIGGGVIAATMEEAAEKWSR